MGNMAASRRVHSTEPTESDMVGNRGRPLESLR